MESRVTRYSKKNRLKRKIKKGIKNLLKNLIKNIIYLLVGLAYIIYSLIRVFNNLIARLFMKLPRIMKVSIIYLLIANVLLDIYEIIKIDYDYKNVSVLSEKLNVNYEPVNLTIEEENKEECIFDSISCKIAEKGQELGLNEEQILISIAISKWETGNYTSDAFINKNNVGGMMCNSGLISYNSLDEGINAFLINLRDNYFGIGLDTLEKIQPKYCPVGAANDPNNLNQYWLNGTTKMYNELISK